MVNDGIDYEPENDLAIGIYKDNNEAYPFKGEIAEVRIWNRVKTQAEIQDFMNQALAGNESGLVGYWPLNDNVGKTCKDLTNNNNPGEFVGYLTGNESDNVEEQEQEQEPIASIEITTTEVEAVVKSDEQVDIQSSSLVVNQLVDMVVDMEEKQLETNPETTALTQSKSQLSKDKNPQSPYKILSIDGGGIRGIIPAIILQEIERRTQKPISSLFDIIAGTSTGGILGLGLSKPKNIPYSENPIPEPEYTAEDLVSLFTEYGNVIFFEPLYVELMGQLEEIIKPKYNNDSREDIIRKYFGLTAIDEALTEVLVPSYDLEQRVPVIFTSESQKENIESRQWRKICYGFTMKDAAMATSAVPSYFVPYRILTEHNRNGFYTLVDGGVVANNPTGLAVTESIINAKKAKQKGGKTWSIDDTLVLSLGTGSLTKPYPYYEAKKWGLVSWARPMLNIVVDASSESVSNQMSELFAQNDEMQNQQYYRLQANINKSLESMDKAKYEHINQLIQVGKKLINDRTAEIDELCQKLVG